MLISLETPHSCRLAKNPKAEMVIPLSVRSTADQKMDMEHRTTMILAKRLTQVFNIMGRMGQDFVVPRTKSIGNGC